MANSVEAPSASAPSELGEIRRLQNLMRFTVVLSDFVEHNSPRRHIDAYSKCFCRKHHLHKPLCETLLHGFLEAGYESRVVHSNARFQLTKKTCVVQSSQIIIGKSFNMAVQIPAIISRSCGVVNEMPSFRHACAASSHWLRLKIK